MNREEIVVEVNNLMHQGFEIPRDKLVPAATLFDELGLDSLDAIDMLVHLEEKLQIKVAGERLKQVRTLDDIYNLVSEVALQSDPDNQSPVSEVAPQSDANNQQSH